MAYGVRYRGEWRSTTRGERNYVVDILKDGYNGVISPMYLTGDCVTITYGEVDESELQPIKSSEAEISILCTEIGDPYLELFTLDPKQYQVVIYENSSVIWRGYIATGDYAQSLARVPYAVRIRATDGLGVLKAMSYIDDAQNRFNTIVSVSALIRRLLSPISDSVDIWDYAPIYANQSLPTFDITSIPDSSIYNAFQGEEPTYYDVLEEVLRTFGVQLFQHNGLWCVRSLAMLANVINANSVRPIPLDVVDDSGFGIKSDATLTILPPLKEMTAPEQGALNSVDLSEMLCTPSNWFTGSLPLNLHDNYKPYFNKYGSALAIKSGRNLSPPVIFNAGWNVIPTIVGRTQNAKLTVGVDLYNNDEDGVSAMYMGVWLVAPSDDASDLMSWSAIDYNEGEATINFSRTAIYWDAGNNKWVNLGKSKKNPKYSSLGLQQVKIDKGAVTGGRPALSTMSNTHLTFELPELPTITVDGKDISTWQIAIVVAIFANNIVYLANPDLTIDIVDGLATPSDSAIVICKDGIDIENYSPKWLSGTGQLVEKFHPVLIDMSNANMNVFGFVEAMNGTSVKNVVGKMLRDLRYKPSRVIDGELDKPMTYGLNTVAKYDGRFFYVNYIQSHLKRGVSSIQLRELTHLNNLRGSIIVDIVSLQNTETAVATIGLERSFYYLTSKNNLKRCEVPNGSAIIVATANSSDSFSPKLTKGVGCVVLADEVDDGPRVRAYNDKGELVAQVVGFYGPDGHKGHWLTTARYDAIAQVWLASDEYRNVVMYDSDGYVLSSFTCAKPDLSSEITDAEIMPYNGGFIYRFYSKYDSGTPGFNVEASYYCYWHSYSIHKSGEFDRSLLYDNIRLVSERYFAYINADKQWGLMRLRGEDFMSEGIFRFATFTTEGYAVKAINNAIAAIDTGDGLAIYDTRNTSSMNYYKLSDNVNGSTIVLCGDLVYAKSSAILQNTYIWNRIVPKIGRTSINTTTDGDL